MYSIQITGSINCETRPVIETARLILRKLTGEDAEFILELLNDPAWLQFIGDKGVRNLADAGNYILQGPVAMYSRCGFGLYLAELKSNCAPVGICGLIKRHSLKDVDIGFAFLPDYRGQGYAPEAAAAVLEYAKNVLGLTRIVAITASDNQSSIRVLEKIGMRFEQMAKLNEDEPEISLFAYDALAIAPEAAIKQ